MDKIIKTIKNWSILNHVFETSMLDNIASTTPWLAPIVPAYIAQHNMVHVLNFPVVIAIIGAMVIEFLGMGTITTAFQFWDWNDKKRVSDQAAPFTVAVIVAVYYLIVVITVNIILEPKPVIHSIAKALLSSLGVVAVITLAIRSQHARRVETVEQQKTEKKRKNSESSGKDNGNLPESSHDWRNLSTTEREMLKGLSPSQIQEIFPAISDKTARNWARRVK